MLTKSWVFNESDVALRESAQLPKPNGSGTYVASSVDEVMLHDGRIFYVCTALDCDSGFGRTPYVSSRIQSVHGHAVSHHGKKSGRKSRKLGPVGARVIEVMREHANQWITTREIAEILGVGHTPVSSVLSHLKNSPHQTTLTRHIQHQGNGVQSAWRWSDEATSKKTSAAAATTNSPLPAARDAQHRHNVVRDRTPTEILRTVADVMAEHRKRTDDVMTEYEKYVRAVAAQIEYREETDVSPEELRELRETKRKYDAIQKMWKD